MGTFFDAIIRELMVLFIAAMPIMELRGAIPIGVSMGLSPLHATILGIAGSILPVPFLLLFLEPIVLSLRKKKVFRESIDKVVKRTIKKGKNINRYSILGLVIFVAIPIPGTGVWTGSLAAVLFNIPFKHAFPAIALGSSIAGIIMFVLSYIMVSI